jgi:signal peptidase I
MLRGLDLAAYDERSGRKARAVRLPRPMTDMPTESPIDTPTTASTEPAAESPTQAPTSSPTEGVPEASTEGTPEASTEGTREGSTEDTPEVSTERRRNPRLGCLFEVIETLVLTVLIFLAIHTFVAQPYQVQQDSMENTLLSGQYVLVDKLTPRWAAYERGDIVVFQPPLGFRTPEDTPFIKRVIGLPGDTVDIHDGSVFVDGVELDEGYVNTESGIGTEPGLEGSRSWTVPAGRLFVMGDHRTVSEDSRAFGPIEISSVLGRAWLRYWPLDTFGVLARPTYTPAP